MRCGLLLALAILSGCGTPPVKPVVPLVAIPAEVVQEFQASVAAWNAGNLNGFLQIYSDLATFTTPEGFLRGKRAIYDFYAPSFEPGASRDALTLDQLDVEVLCPEAVLVRGFYRSSFNGQTTRTGPTTLVMRRILGRWQIIHDHSS